jgi:hypothetical protein
MDVATRTYWDNPIPPNNLDILTFNLSPYLDK